MGDISPIGYFFLMIFSRFASLGYTNRDYFSHAVGGFRKHFRSLVRFVFRTIYVGCDFISSFFRRLKFFRISDVVSPHREDSSSFFYENFNCITEATITIRLVKCSYGHCQRSSPAGRVN